jgi:DNA-binding CsgD family transcriptional regulator
MNIDTQINLIKLLKNRSLQELDPFFQLLALKCDEKQEMKIAMYVKNSDDSFQRVTPIHTNSNQAPTEISGNGVLVHSDHAEWSTIAYPKKDSLIADQELDSRRRTVAYPIAKNGADSNLFLLATCLNPEVRLSHLREMLHLAAELLELKLEQTTATGIRQVLGSFTLRQSKVLELVLSGKTNKEVAWKLGVSVPTVKHDLKQIFDTFGVSNRSGLSRKLNRFRTSEYGPMS